LFVVLFDVNEFPAFTVLNYLVFDGKYFVMIFPNSLETTLNNRKLWICCCCWVSISISREIRNSFENIRAVKMEGELWEVCYRVTLFLTSSSSSVFLFYFRMKFSPTQRWYVRECSTPHSFVLQHLPLIFTLESFFFLLLLSTNNSFILLCIYSFIRWF
jgi:hypothetical protein